MRYRSGLQYLATGPIMQNDRLDAEIRVSRFGQNQESTYHLDSSTPWVAELLEEMQESLEKDELPSGSELKVDLVLANKDNASLQEHFIIKGHIHGTYHTACIRCLIPATEQVDAKFSCCFLPNHLEKSSEYEETTEVYCDDQNMDLYFTEPKGLINLKELVHEQIYMSIEPLPLHDEACKGLCMTCGTNLNTDTCTHSQPA